MLKNLQHLTACFIQKGQRGLDKGQTLGYFTFDKKVFDSIKNMLVKKDVGKKCWLKNWSEKHKFGPKIIG